MSATNRLAIAAGILIVGAVAFWMMLLSPKREESAAITEKVDNLDAQVSQVRQMADAAEAAKDGYAEDYEQLVLLGKAVPGDDDTASLIVQVDTIARDAGVDLRALVLGQAGGGAVASTTPEAPAPAPAAPGAAAPAATEASAALLPIGASVGSAGLGVMPYEISIKGEFFEIAEFIKGLDALVKTTNGSLAADGRLITVDGFGLEADDDLGFPHLEASFAVTTYLTPPGQGVTAGATPAAPAPVTPPTTTTTTP